MTLVLVVHHSMMGHTAIAADRLAEGVRSVPGATCISKPVLAEGVTEGDAAKREDFKDADALVLGCPVHQRSVSWEMKRFIDLHCEPSCSGTTWWAASAACSRPVVVMAVPAAGRSWRNWRCWPTWRASA